MAHKKIKWHLTHDTWKKDMWHLTHDAWHVTYSGAGWMISKNFSSLPLMVWEWRHFQDSEEKSEGISELLNFEDVCRIAFAKPGILTMWYVRQRKFTRIFPLSNPSKGTKLFVKNLTTKQKAVNLPQTVNAHIKTILEWDGVGAECMGRNIYINISLFSPKNDK